MSIISIDEAIGLSLSFANELSQRLVVNNSANDSGESIVWEDRILPGYTLHWLSWFAYERYAVVRVDILRHYLFGKQRMKVGSGHKLTDLIGAVTPDGANPKKRIHAEKVRDMSNGGFQRDV